MLEIPPLPDTTILLVEVGSTAHGTGIPGGEDHDELGVVVEPPEQVLGLDEVGFRTVMQRTQPEGAPSGPGDVDRTLHSLRRFVRLAASGNPSVLMSFWAPVEHSTAEGEELRALGEAFVGRHVILRYQGYLRSQARKVSPASYETSTKSAMHSSRLGFQCLELLQHRHLDLPIRGEPADWLRAVRRGEVPHDEWSARTRSLDDQLEAAMTDDSVPEQADRARIDRWLVDVHQRVWARA